MTLIVTQAGLTQALRADSLGISLKITHVALGSEGYRPTKKTTALKNELLRVPVAGGKNVDGNQIHITAVFDQKITIKAREIGFFLEDGTLFAVDSAPVNVLIYKAPSTVLVKAFDLILDAVPLASVTVDLSGDLNLYYVEPFAQMAITQINNARRSVRAFMRASAFTHLTKDF